MHAGPLADDFRPRSRILDLVGGGAGILIGGDVANAVAAGLQRVHLHLGQFREDVRDVLSAGQLYWMFCRVVKWP